MPDPLTDLWEQLMTETTVRENVFTEDECLVLARFLSTPVKTVDAIGYLAWMKVNGSPAEGDDE